MGGGRLIALAGSVLIVIGLTAFLRPWPDGTTPATATRTPRTATAATVPAMATSTAAAATPTPAAPTTNSPPGWQPSFPIRAAFYYPWFPEGWKQQGMNPFTHYHPSLGRYDVRSPAVLAAQIRAMRYAGLQAGIASWWGPGSLTDRNLAPLLNAVAGQHFRWGVYHEGEGDGDPTVSQLTADLTYLRDRYGKDPHFLRIGGRFVVFVYAQSHDGCAMADRWKRANTVGAYVVLKLFRGYKTCASQLDGWHQYGPLTAVSDHAPFSYSVSPGFWKADEPTPGLKRNLDTWRHGLKDMVASQARFQLVTTFNEWGEGTSVESATEWASPSGMGEYLDALHDIVGG